MAARTIITPLFILFLATQGTVQDKPSGPPVALQIRFTEAPNPFLVAGRAGILEITAIDQYGRLSPLNGTTAGCQVSDPKCALNGKNIPFQNGVIRVKVRWFTAGNNHSIKATTKTGLKGELGNIKVEALPKNIKIELEQPNPNPKYLWSGATYKLKGKITSDGNPIEGLQVSSQLSTGTFTFPGDIITDSTGNFECHCFTPSFVCPTNPGDPGTVDGNPQVSISLFVDCNGDSSCTNIDPSLIIPPIPVVQACPQELIPCALAILQIISNGGPFPPPPPDEILVTSLTFALSKPEMAKIRDAIKYTQEQIIDLVNSGKWNGKFSDVKNRVEHIVGYLKGIPLVQPAVQRLECAAHLLAGNPDVHHVRLDGAGDGVTLDIPVGSTSRFTLENVSTGNKTLQSNAFSSCFKPSLTGLNVTGKGVGFILDAFSLRFRFDCTGPGIARISATETFQPEEVIILPPPDGGGGGVVASASVTSGSIDLLPQPLTFALSGFFVIKQDPKKRPVLEIAGIAEDKKRTKDTFALAKNDDDDDLVNGSDLNQVGPIKADPTKGGSQDEDNLWPIILRVEGLAAGTVTLTITKKADKIRVWRDPFKDPNAVTPNQAGGHKGMLQFKNSDNVFEVKDLPVVLWVEGVQESENSADVELTLVHSDGKTDTPDTANLTVLWVTEITAKSAATDKVSDDNSGAAKYKLMTNGDLD